jgi:hypothetical protein
MNNRGKVWSIDDDQKLMEEPHLPNAYFASAMGRTENAIKYRRAHLAVRMYQNDQGSADLAEYVCIMHADYDQATAILDEWDQKRATLQTCMDRNRKRKLETGHGSPPIDRAAPSQAGLGDPSPMPPRNDPIVAICKRICDENGNLTTLWNSPENLPHLVQNYPGFAAYAKVVRVLSASGAQALNPRDR